MRNRKKEIPSPNSKTTKKNVVFINLLGYKELEAKLFRHTTYLPSKIKKKKKKNRKMN